ncbi:lipoprotein [Nevskia sp.]|uniref:LPS translocon maturation chaperone LptM n=1 Tax=Nevskia sp. TaxID=1929292 RepID=UPI0034585EF4
MSARALFIASLLAVTGCGQTGALHLPADAPSREGYLIGSNPNAKKKAAAEPAAPAPAAVETPAEAPATP